jgi:hypothetical protein
MNDQAASNGVPSVASLPQSSSSSILRSTEYASCVHSTIRLPVVTQTQNTTTMTMTEEAEAPPQESQDEVLTLTLRARPGVTGMKLSLTTNGTKVLENDVASFTQATSVW